MQYIALSLLYGFWVALLLAYVDRWEREPPLMLFGAFFWGAVPSILLAYISLTSIGNPLAIVVIEELTKALILFMYVTSERREINSWVDMYTYASLVGFGFGWAEGLVYLFFDPHYFLARLFFSPIHAIWTSMIGISIARGLLGSIVWMWLGVGAAIGLHFFHNTYGPSLYIPSLVLWILVGTIEYRRHL